MRHLLKFYKAVFRIIMARYLEYRTETFIWLVQVIIRPVLFLVVWSAAARTTGGQMAGYGPSELAAYFIVGILVHHVVSAWPMFGWEERVKLGSLSYLLLRPVDVIHRDIGENITFKTLTLPAVGLTAVALWLAFDATIHTSAWALAAAVPVILLGAVLCFLLSWTVAMAVFYTTQIDATNTAFFFAMLLCSGQLAPRALMPPALDAVTSWLPFWWYVGFPIELILGHFTPVQALRGIGMQVVWIGVTFAVMTVVYQRGLRNYTAVGI